MSIRPMKLSAPFVDEEALRRPVTLIPVTPILGVAVAALIVADVSLTATVLVWLTLVLWLLLGLPDAIRRFRRSPEDLRKMSIKPISPEEEQIFQLVRSATREPIKSVQYKEEIQRAPMKIQYPGYDAPVPCQEFFPYDVRVRTGYQFTPLSGHGHTVELTKTAEGGWRIAEVGRWIS